jgi:hypothetical protein
MSHGQCARVELPIVSRAAAGSDAEVTFESCMSCIKTGSALQKSTIEVVDTPLKIANPARSRT